MADRIPTYAAFWPYYLREHANPRTRAIHAIGTAVGLVLLVAGVVAGLWWLVPAAIVVGYAFAWGSHMLVERNRPATFTYPAWSLYSDLRMAWLMATGRLGPELEKAGLR